MKTLSEFEISIVESLITIADKTNQTTKDWIEQFFFTEDEGRALIIQAKENYGVFFLKKEIFDDDDLKQQEESKFHQLIHFLNYLKSENYITQSRGKQNRSSQMFFIQDSFRDPQPTKGAIILNAGGEYTESPNTIQNHFKEIVYEGITYDHDVFDLILSTLTGSLFVSPTIHQLIKDEKKEESTKKKKNRPVFFIVVTILLVLIIGLIVVSHFHLLTLIKPLHSSILDKGHHDSDSLVANKNITEVDDLSSTKDTLYGIDISKWNGNIIEDIGEQSDLNFIICRASEGLTIKDDEFHHNWKSIKKKKLIRGAYHFYMTDDDPIEQAKHFTDIIGELDNNDIAPILDIESGSIPEDNPIDVSDLHIDLILFLKEVEKITGRKPIIYTSEYFANEYLTYKRFSKYRLWLAEYSNGSNPKVPSTWVDVGWMIWQKSSSYSINNKKNDFDMFIGEEWELFM
ncbi:GH25 family lysozyme [Flammeovirga pacifica]|uniref:Lysozyme n=1 Tax=Flammeovirga pacifica TaxID=915059 RepID=A0A1S1YSI8_FLAPC|nr:GH25 family lysozyme [Flammeovirga pacifica]OHX63978.1 hypothetical protein NH26_20420 [Flammeovirga pacifica]